MEEKTLLTCLTWTISLRSKRFRRAIRPFEAFLAFWLRKNWGEKIGATLLEAIFASKKRKCLERAESLTETLATQAIGQ